MIVPTLGLGGQINRCGRVSPGYSGVFSYYHRQLARKWNKLYEEMASRSCKHSPDSFYYICGQLIKIRAKHYTVTTSGYLILPTSTVKKLYKDGTEGKREPGSSPFQEFSVNSLTTQAIDTFAWWTLPNIGRKNASAIMYPDLPSSITSVPRCSELPVPAFPEIKQQIRRGGRR
ncbi:uncharacterized protein LOC143225015 [Tachypleus tridentatus]|uniref:uncharacterized protein LOC143225015 n=1 Tax=Tachypleus tridentatus TaxID=6853 RepID=UPI003FD337A2